MLESKVAFDHFDTGDHNSFQNQVFKPSQEFINEWKSDRKKQTMSHFLLYFKSVLLDHCAKESIPAIVDWKSVGGDNVYEIPFPELNQKQFDHAAQLLNI